MAEFVSSSTARIRRLVFGMVWWNIAVYLVGVITVSLDILLNLKGNL